MPRQFSWERQKDSSSREFFEVKRKLQKSSQQLFSPPAQVRWRPTSLKWLHQPTIESQKYLWQSALIFILLALQKSPQGLVENLKKKIFHCDFFEILFNLISTNLRATPVFTMRTPTPARTITQTVWTIVINRGSKVKHPFTVVYK